jgi:hypothetical protein
MPAASSRRVATVRPLTQNTTTSQRMLQDIAAVSQDPSWTSI